jgi:uncharacterized damage-inducible protein DinB
MVDVPVIQELYRYNRWANDRMFEAVSSLTQAEFTKDLAGSHPSVRETLTHIVWAEWIWLQRWKGTSPQVVFGARDSPDVRTLRATVRQMNCGKGVHNRPPGGSAPC